MSQLIHALFNPYKAFRKYIRHLSSNYPSNMGLHGPCWSSLLNLVSFPLCLRVHMLFYIHTTILSQLLMVAQALKYQWSSNFGTALLHHDMSPRHHRCPRRVHHCVHHGAPTRRIRTPNSGPSWSPLALGRREAASPPTVLRPWWKWTFTGEPWGLLSIIRINI